MGVFMLSVIGLLLLQPGDKQEALNSGDMLDVTRNSSEPMLTARAVAPKVENVVQPEPAVENQLATLQKLQTVTAASLAKKAMVSASGDMRALTSEALSNLRGKAPDTVERGQMRLASLVSQSMSTQRSDDFTSAVAREAKYGTEDFTKLAMVGAAVDTSDVKKRWIENARKKSKAMADATAFMSSGTQTTPGFDDTIHIVKRGDSLMKLSVRYYGRTIDYQLIFEANREVLESPDRIRVGQKLKIPPMTNV